MDLQSFGISEKTGFCLEDPLTDLGEEFSVWHQTATTMPELIERQTVRQQVKQMPVLDTSALTTRRQRLLAHLQLSVIAAGYVWGCGNDVAKSLPSCVAVPLHALSEQLGLEPVTCHATRTLSNWALVNPKDPVSLENLRPLYPFLNAGEEGAFFNNIISFTEITFAPALKALVGVLSALDEGGEKDDVIISNLEVITEVIKDMSTIVSRLPEKFNWDTFLVKIMPLTIGWGDPEDTHLPEGLVFEGVSDTLIKAGSDTAGQSAILQTLDALLGIRPAEEANRKCLLLLRSRMLPDHIRFIETIEQRQNSLSGFVEKSTNTDLRDAYKSCVKAVADFRTTHYKMFAKYMTQAVKKLAQTAEDKETKELYENVDFSEPRELLRDQRQSTLNKKLSEPPMAQ